jgi:hypothetical protein
MSKLDEVNIIMNLEINTNKYLAKLVKKYKHELNGFQYVSTINDIIQLKKVFIRYISIKGLLGYGGFLNKVIEKNNKYYILLVNHNRKIWEISFNDNFIFYKNIENNNDQKRSFFSDLLKKYT